MKKLLFLFLAATVFIACSSDDDNAEQEGPDPIIGTWVLTDINPALASFEGCEEESVITFNSNNSGEGTFYFEDDCEAQTSSGDWENRGNSQYLISVPVLGDLTGTANFSGNTFTFNTSIVGQAVTFTFEKQ